MTNIQLFLVNILLTSLVVNVGLAIYGLIFRPSMIKKIIALTILTDSSSVLAVIIGYRFGKIPAITVNLEPLNPEYPEYLVSKAVDPLPQALVITAIVIGLALTVFLSVVTVRLYEVLGTVDLHKALSIEAEERIESEIEVPEE